MNSQLLSDLIELGAGSIRRMDCLIALTLNQSFDSEVLTERVKIAQSLYPETAKFPIRIENHQTLVAFEETPLPDKHQLSLALINQKTLALKMSHYLGDAVSMLLFLEVLLTGAGIEGKIAYRSFPAKKDSPYRNLLPVQEWMHHFDVTPARQYIYQEFIHPVVPEGQTLNDLLSLALLRSLPKKARALWIPVNVRKVFWQGFGNGLSRMRLYPAKRKLSTLEELKHIRRQKIEAFHSGEIALPPKTLKLTPFKKLLIKSWLNRPWADWGTLSFSHLDDRLNRFENIKSLYGITNLHEKHQAGFFAFTKAEKTFITLTFDQSVPPSEAKHLLNNFHSNFQDILYELNS